MLHLYPILGLFLILFASTAQAETPVTYSDVFIPPECEVVDSSLADKTNRYGGRLITDFDTQLNLVKAGNAIALPSNDLAPENVQSLYAAEQQTRKNIDTCYPDNYFVDAIALAAQDYVPAGFRVVEGTVFSIYKSREWTYINFEEDWKTDTTIRFDHRKKPFKTFDTETLKDKRIRARGFVSFYNGPSLRLEHPHHIEVLEQDTEDHE